MSAAAVISGIVDEYCSEITTDMCQLFIDTLSLIVNIIIEGN